MAGDAMNYKSLRPGYRAGLKAEKQAKYEAHAASVRAGQERKRAMDKMAEFCRSVGLGHLPLTRETQEYVKGIVDAYEANGGKIKP
jgi:hypothetical protein